MDEICQSVSFWWQPVGAREQVRHRRRRAANPQTRPGVSDAAPVRTVPAHRLALPHDTPGGRAESTRTRRRAARRVVCGRAAGPADSEVERERIGLLFGPGGTYTVDDLQRRSAMLDLPRGEHRADERRFACAADGAAGVPHCRPSSPGAPVATYMTRNPNRSRPARSCWHARVGRLLRLGSRSWHWQRRIRHFSAVRTVATKP
jgi:hypothetical protein